MTIGEMSQRLKIQERIRTLDEGGGFSVVWEDLSSLPAVYAAIHPVSGSEQFRHHKPGFTATHKIRIRYRTDITTEMRLRADDVSYDILSVMDMDGRKNYLEIMAQQREA